MINDWDGNCIRVIYADGGTERRFYDGEGHMTRQVMPESYDGTTNDGLGYSYRYDVRGRLVQVQDPEGNIIRRYEYNGHGQVVRETDGEGKETLYSYDADGNVSLLETKLKEETLLSFTYQYDGNGNRIEKVGEQGFVGGGNRQIKAAYAYDVRGQLIRRTSKYRNRIARNGLPLYL